MALFLSLPLASQIVIGLVVVLIAVVVLLFLVNEFVNHYRSGPVTDQVASERFDDFVHQIAAPIYFFYDRPAPF